MFSIYVSVRVRIQELRTCQQDLLTRKGVLIDEGRAWRHNTAENEARIEEALRSSSDELRELLGDDVVARPREFERENRDRFMPAAGESRTSLRGADRVPTAALGVELKVCVRIILVLTLLEP